MYSDFFGETLNQVQLLGILNSCTLKRKKYITLNNRSQIIRGFEHLSVIFSKLGDTTNAAKSANRI